MLFYLVFWKTVSSRAKINRKLLILITSHHRPAVRKAFSLLQTHKVPVLHHCLVEVHDRDCSEIVLATWQLWTRPEIPSDKQMEMEEICILPPLKLEFYSEYYIISCFTSSSMGVFLCTSEKRGQCFSGLHCHVKNLTLSELL